MVLTLATATIVAGIAIPRLGGATSRYEADFMARRIVADLHRTRSNALLTGQTQTCTFFSPRPRTYTVSGSGSGLTAGYMVNMRDIAHDVKILAADFGGSAAATFNRFGDAVAGGTVQVRVNDNVRTITLDAASGRARWQ